MQPVTIFKHDREGENLKGILPYLLNLKKNKAMNNDKRTTRENAMLWWNNLGNAEKIKFWNKYPYMIPSFSTRLPKDLTGVEIERLYTAEHPTETESKGQEPEVDLLAHDNYPFGSTAELGSRERSLYEHKKESFIAGYNSLAEQNKLLREALRKNHQWAVCLLADIEAGNVEYDEKYCLELNQDISETTNLLK